MPRLEGVVRESEARRVGNEPAVQWRLREVEPVGVRRRIRREPGRCAEIDVHGKAGAMRGTRGAHEPLTIMLAGAPRAVIRRTAESGKDGEEPGVGWNQSLATRSRCHLTVSRECLRLE